MTAWKRKTDLHKAEIAACVRASRGARATAFESLEILSRLRRAGWKNAWRESWRLHRAFGVKTGLAFLKWLP